MSEYVSYESVIVKNKKLNENDNIFIMPQIIALSIFVLFSTV
jgi:hypothetical protein